MPFFHYEPRRTKPPELDPVCRDLCTLYEESHREMGFLRRMLFGNPFLTVNVRRCKHHPLYCNPDDPVKCPFAHLLGSTMIEIYCDICKRSIRLVSPASQEANARMETRDEEGKSVLDVCDECRKKGL